MKGLMKDEFLETKAKLDKISPTFCAIKWKHTSINLSAGTVKTCCHHQFHPIEKSGLINDHKADRKVRWDLLQGLRPPECNYCWQMEDTGHFSDRIYWSGKPWVEKYMQDLPRGVGGKVQPPSWLELNFSPTCNLKCSYCNPEVSSSWYKEASEHGPYPTNVPHNDPAWFEDQGKSPYKSEAALSPERFWPWLAKVISGVRLLTITGGEPLLAKETFQLLDWLYENPQPQMEVSLNSNCSLPESLWKKFLEHLGRLEEGQKVKTFFLHPSLEAWGPQAEYIRFGLDLSLFQKNVRKYLEDSSYHLIVNCTLNALSLPSLKDYWAYIKGLADEFPNREVSSTVENLSYPAWQSTRVLPERDRFYFEEAYDFVKSNLRPLGPFAPHTLDALDRARKHMCSSSSQLEVDRRDFYRFFSEHDRRRGTNFQATFPEFEEFWKECSVLPRGELHGGV